MNNTADFTALILAGNNTYIGAATINGGILLVLGTSGTGSGQVTGPIFRHRELSGGPL
jgi:autotransporter-associated beta strand protein